MTIINRIFVSNYIAMKKIATLAIVLLLPLMLVAQSKSTSYGNRMYNNLYIVKGSDTIWIQQDGSYAWFSATDTIYFGSVTSLPDAISTTQATGDSTANIATTEFVQIEILASCPLPSIVGQENKLLSNNGIITDWTDTLRADFYMGLLLFT